MNEQVKHNEEGCSDEQHLIELEEFARTLPVPTPEQIAMYGAKILYMESIHDEIKKNNPDFMPVYDINEDREENPGTKYMETVYRVHPINSNED